MVFAALLIIILLVILVSVLPTWSHSKSWGYFPSSSIGFVLIVIVVLMLTRVF